MTDIILDRELFFQQELNKFPAILHVDGEKKRLGYIIFFALHIAYVLVLPIESWLTGESEKTTLFYLYAMAFIYSLVTFFRYYCIKNKFNTFLFISLAVGMVFPIRNMLVFHRKGLADAISLLITFLTSAWIVLAVFIRGKCMSIACERYRIISNVEAEKDKIKLFDRSRKKRDEVPDLSTTFLDDEPNWNSRTVLKKSKVYCPKCGFGLVDGETECHVCGTQVITGDPGQA